MASMMVMMSDMTSTVSMDGYRDSQMKLGAEVLGRYGYGFGVWMIDIRILTVV